MTKKEPCEEHRIASKNINDPTVQGLMRNGYKAAYCDKCKYIYLEKK